MFNNNQGNLTPGTPVPVREKVLVFGGNGFIGSELVHSLIQKQKYDISIVSRGNWYFDSETRIKPFVRHFVCDRESSDLEYCVELMTLISESHFKVVIDFSAYKPEVLQESVEILNNKTDLYVYISSDSIYEVCQDRTYLNGGLSKEIDSIRPENEERDRLNELDEYGNEKLMGEEVLIANRADGGSPYLILRLPDVIGPRDTTERIWTYIMWIQFFDFIEVPIFIPKHVQTLKTSFVYVTDVVQAILHLIDKQIQDDIFNVGFEQIFTLQEFLERLAVELGQTIQFDFTASESFNLFPSVTRGAVDVTKLRDTGFHATDFTLAIQETIKFYKDAFYIYESEKDDVVHQLTKHVIKRQRKGEFLKFIDKVTTIGAAGDFNLEMLKRTEL